MKIKIICLFILLFFLACTNLKAQVSPKNHASMHSLGGWIKEHSERLEIAVWLPTTKSESYIELDGLRLLRLNSKILEPQYKYPLILIAHDTVGNRFSNHDLAEELARAGFVVAAPTHPNDNIDNMSQMLTFEGLVARPRQLVYTLEALLNSEEISKYIDTERIGVIGVGNGAATALQLIGAVPQTQLWAQYCDNAKSDDSYCQPFTKQLTSKMIEDLGKFKLNKDSFMLTPPLHSSLFPIIEPKIVEAPVVIASKNATSKEKTQDIKKETKRDKKTKKTIVVASPPPENIAPAANIELIKETLALRKIRSALLLAPGHAFLFGVESFADLDLPIAVLFAENDELYPPEQHALPLSGILPGMPEQSIFNNSDHYSLITPISKKLSSDLPEFLGSEAELKKEKNLTRRNKEAILFFKKTLKNPTPLVVAPASI